MPFTLVREETKFDIGAGKGVVVLEADTPTELDELATRKYAIEVAKANGLVKAGISDPGAPYPTRTAENPDGTPSFAAIPGVKYRRDVQVAGGP